ncbi:UNVERIFIED_CONTAM: hypothetical protein GTU68_017831, partial [Idotea baltica]|nr:hypothetical protein [Idotea baltica]
MYKGEVNVLQESLPGLIKAAEALKIKGLAVPDDNTPKERSSPSRERKRSTNSTSTSHPSKSRRLEDNSESRENLNCEVNDTSRTNRESRLDQLDKSKKGENGSSEFNSDADHDTPTSNSGLQSFIKTEPSERTNPAPDDVRSPGYTLPDTQMKDEGLNFASLLPNDSNEEESSKNAESHSYNEQSSHLYSMEESYQECFNNSATMREELGVPWSEERAGTSTEADLDG